MLYLHIGFHKAGSTTLQTFVRDNTEALAAAGVVYPEIGRGRDAIAHHALGRGLKRRREPPSADTERLWREVAELAGRESNVLISSEGLEPSDPAPLAQWLQGVPVKVIAYVRELPGRLVSIYGQSTKRGQNTLDFDDFLTRELTLERSYTAPKLKVWAELFGAQNIRIRSTDPSCLEGGDIITDFLVALGLGPDARERLGLVGGGVQNVTPGWRTLEVLRSLNAEADWSDDDDVTGGEDARSPGGSLLRAAQDAEASLGWGERGLYLSEEQIARAVKIDREDIAEVEALGVDARLKPASAGAIPPRTFLPNISDIPAEAVTRFYREMLIASARQVMLRPRRLRGRQPDEPPAVEPPAAAPLKAEEGRGWGPVGRWLRALVRWLRGAR